MRILWEVIILTSVRTNIRINVSISEWLPEIELFQSGLYSFFFVCLDTRFELFVRILGAATRVKRSEDQLIRTKSDLRTRVAKCVEAENGVFRIFIVKCDDFFLFLCYKFFF